MGNKAYGFQAAALTYFGKEIKDLPLSDLAMLVALSLDPVKADPYKNYNQALAQRNIVLRALEVNGYIDKTTLNNALQADLKLENAFKGYIPTYATDIAYETLARIYGKQIANSGYNVYLTITKEEQDYTQMIMRTQLVETEKTQDFKGAIKTLWQGGQAKPERDVILEELARIPVYAPLFPVVVTNITNEQATFLNAWGSEVTLPLEQLTWALSGIKAKASTNTAPATSTAKTPETKAIPRATDEPVKAILPSALSELKAPGQAVSSAIVDSVTNAALKEKAEANAKRLAEEEAAREKEAEAKRLEEEAKLRATVTLSQVLHEGDVIYLMVKPQASGFERAASIYDLTAGINPFQAFATTDFTLAQIPKSEGAYISIDSNSGAIQTVVGGFDSRINKRNLALEETQEMGGLIRPFIMSYALHHNLTLATIAKDEEIDIGGQWKARNDSGSASGAIFTFRQGFYKNLNTISVSAAALVSENLTDFGDYYSHFGGDYATYVSNPRLLIGDQKESPLALARAYASFNNGGFLVSPYIIDKITFNPSYATAPEVIYQANPKVACDTCNVVNLFANYKPGNTSGVGQDTDVYQALNYSLYELPQTYGDMQVAPRVLSSDQAYLVNNLLYANVGNGVTGSSLQAVNRSDVAGLTATNSSHSVGWSAGFIGHNTIVSYLLNDVKDKQGSSSVALALNRTLWATVNNFTMRNKQAYRPAMPSNIRSVKIDPENGLLSDNGYTEYFIAGTEPKESAYVTYEVVQKVEVVETKTVEVTKTVKAPVADAGKTESKSEPKVVVTKKEKSEAQKAFDEKKKADAEKKRKQYNDDGTFNDDEFGFNND